jgi:RNA polymerase sigma-70 factor (ECF subfamily)
MRAGPTSQPPQLAPSQGVTPASIFLRLKQSDPAPRELAWQQFYAQYAPVIANYARQRGASAQQADEAVQDVMSGFFAASPRFVYDPKRGRFRAYLKTCASRAVARIHSAAVRAQDVPTEELEIVDDRDEALWQRLWQQQILRRALDAVREHYAHNGKLATFQAFELNVVEGLPAPEVAKRLGMNVQSVHTAKNRVTEKLRAIRATLHDEEG